MDPKIIRLNNPALHLGKSIFRGRLDAENYVDMGLPSGTKWAASNLDVTTPSKLAASPFQYECSFFSWGNIIGHNPISNTAFGYDFGGINAAAPWYEGQPYGETLGSTLTNDIPINENFDAARAILGAPWQTPVYEDFVELIEGSIYINADGIEIPDENTNKLITINSIVGVYLQSKNNGARLFLSASGFGRGLTWGDYGTNGYYWTRSFVSPRSARSMSFRSGGVFPLNYYDRYDGYPLRPIMK